MKFPELEAAADELIAEFSVTSPPVPIDTIMMTPRSGMWPKIDLGQLTLSFTSRGDRFAPRISIARLVVRQLVHTDWGQKHNLPELVGYEPDRIADYARMVLIPWTLVEKVPERDRNPIGIAMTFMVPEDDAELRLNLRLGDTGP